jgi:MFS family permease
VNSGGGLELKRGGNKPAIAALGFSAIAFAINTFNIFSMFYLIADELNEDVSFLGLISATMVIGIGLLQVPAGILAAKYGPKNIAILGMVIISASAALVGISSDVYQIAALRFVLGGGLAFFFPAAIVLGSQYIRKGSEGLGAGIVIGSNAAGGVLGLVGWALIAGILGWRAGILIGALLAAIAAIILYLVLPRIAISSSFTIKASHIRALLTDRRLIIIGVILLGSQAAFEQELAFMPFYLQQALLLDPAVAGLVASFTLIGALAGSPLSGWVYDKIHEMRLLVLVLAAGLLGGISVNYFESLSAAIVSAVVVGFAGSGLFTLLSNKARERVVASGEVQHNLEYTTLSVNWIHAIAVTGTFWAPILFSSSAIQFGYPLAWPLIGVLSFVIISASLFLGYKRHTTS